MAIVKGSKKGKNKARQPVIAPDSAQSKTYINILYGLAEGEVEGLSNGNKSIFLEETPLEDGDGNPTYSNVKVDFRKGTNDQEYIEGFPFVESETAVGVELKSDIPWVRAFNNIELDAVRIRLKFGPLRKQDATSGDVSGLTIEYAIDVQTDGGTWTEVLKAKISDKTSANYERAHRIDLPKADTGWLVRVRRITPNSASEYISDKMYIDAVTEVVDAKLRYPNTALLGLRYDAETFGNVAKVAVDLKGTLVLVPSNYDAETRIYTGIWDGTFKRAYTNNPAWIYYDLCTNDRYGLGSRLTPLMVDKWSLYRLAQYCDEMVPDGQGGQEPRFTCNVYLQSAEGAFEILTKLAGVFRAITFWDGMSIICDADIPQDTYFTYTRANVIDGNFEYAGTRARDRHNVVKVAWDNPANHYKTEYEFVRDEKAITEAGQVRILEIDAWGCTSRGQAQRAGWWALKSEQLETRTVSFKVGLDGYIPLPGKVIEIADPLFAGRANGGRVSKISADRKSITLDRDDVVAVAGDRLIINGEDGKAQARIVQSISGRVVTVTHEFDAIAAQNVWVIDAQDLATMKFRVISITQDEHHQFSVTALQYNPAKFDAIDKGAYFDEVPISIVNPSLQDPVTDVVITSESRIDQGINVATMIVSWTQAKGAVKYQVEWRKDDGSWIKLPITGNNSVEVPGIYAGQYQARVTAISAFEIASLPVYSVLTELTGKQGLPPKLAFIQATGILFGIKLDWGFPATGALDTAYTEIQVSPDGTSNIAQLGLFAYPTTTHMIQGLQPNLTQFYRGRLIDRIGNIGPWSDWTHATTSADATDVLELLNDQISESQLNQDLKTKIDHIETIDAEIGPLKQDIQNTKDRIAQEVIDRQNAIQQAKDGLSQQIIDGDKSVLEVVETVKKSSDDGLAAAQESIRVVANDLSLVAEKTDGVYAQLNPPLIGSESDLIGNDQGFAGTWSVQSAMIEGDLALSKRVDTTVAEVNDLRAYAQQEVQARIEGDKVTVQKIDTYIASNDSALATVRESAQIAVEQSSANAEAIDSINLELDDKASTGQLTQVKSDIKNVDDKVIAQTTRIDGVYAQINPPLIGSESDLIGNEGGYAGVWSEQSARIEGDLAQAKLTEHLSAQMNENNAVFKRQLEANSSAISSTIKVTETLQTKVGENSASIQNVSESVDGIYAQQFTKFDVNGHVSGHGSMNDGTTSTFIFNYDCIQFGTPVGIDGIEPKPLMTLQNTPVTLPNGTVIPRGLYVDNASFGYINANRIWAENLSVITANLGTFTSLADQSKPNGARTVISGEKIEVYDENNVMRVRIGRW
ncbi:phage tail protein [Acinetobacter baumannii]|nr:phage tail protein [Acinetobacter baumannii]